jgi:hypothetical protein
MNNIMVNSQFLEKMLAAMEGVIDVADRKTDEFEELRSCVIDLTLMLYAPPQRTEQELCVHAKTPKKCYRVRCQLGDKCVDDEMSFRTAPPQPAPVQDGWILVPVTLTNDMTSAMADALEDPNNERSSWDLAENMWQAMLPKVPTPPQRKPLLASEIVTMYAERPTSDNDMMEFARAIEAAHGIKEKT